MESGRIFATDWNGAREELSGLEQPVIDAIEQTLVTRSNPVQSVVIEPNYVDYETSQAQHMQSARSFRPESAAIRRLHFFSCRVTSRQIDGGSRATIDRLRSNYLGFSVLRKARVTTLGRTAIAPANKVSGTTFYCPTQAQFSVNLNGIDLVVSASPYLSQDGSTLACATAAIWMSTTPLSVKDKFIPSYTTTDITQAALGLSRSYGPNIGNAGLRVDQIKDALLRMGYDIISEQGPLRDKSHALCYGYTESGIPPIAILELPEIGEWHAVTIVGHALDAAPPFPLSIGKRAISSDQYATSFLVHDDRDGMYLPAEFEDRVNSNGAVIGTVLKRKSPGRWTYGILKDLLIPVPSRVALDYKQALAQGMTLLDEFGWGQERILANEVIVRPILLQSTNLKRDLLSRNDLPNVLKTELRRLPMPRYVWVIEYAVKDDWNPSETDPHMRVVGMAVLDSTLPDSVASALLGIQMPGFVQTLVVSGGSVHTKQKPIDEKVTYGTLSISSRP